MERAESSPVPSDEGAGDHATTQDGDWTKFIHPYDPDLTYMPSKKLWMWLCRCGYFVKQPSPAWRCEECGRPGPRAPKPRQSKASREAHRARIEGAS